MQQNDKKEKSLLENYIVREAKNQVFSFFCNRLK